MPGDDQQAAFNGWARVEVMGHQTHIGYVRTEVYGTACLFRIDTPELPEREYTLESPEWIDNRLTPAGSKVKRLARPGSSVLVGASSIYRIIPCSEAAAMRAIENEQRTALKLIEIPESARLAPPEDRTYECCGGTPEDGHEDWCDGDEGDDDTEAV